jgi:hypothetical protein
MNEPAQAADQLKGFAEERCVKAFLARLCGSAEWSRFARLLIVPEHAKGEDQDRKREQEGSHRFD